MAEVPRLFTCQVKLPQLHGLNTLVAQLGVDGGTGGGTNIFSKKKMSVSKGFMDLLESRHGKRAHLTMGPFFMRAHNGAFIIGFEATPTGVWP